jgi:hypothetical protein
MKSLIPVGIVLIILGVLALALPPFHYTQKEDVLKFGPIQATKEVTHEVPIPPAAGWGLIAGGIGIAAVGALNRKA